MKTKKKNTRAFNCKDEELPTIGGYVIFSANRDQADFLAQVQPGVFYSFRHKGDCRNRTGEPARGNQGDESHHYAALCQYGWLDYAG